MGRNDVAIFIVNYNMPERADALAEHIDREVKWPHQLFVIDNGSDLCPPSKYTNVSLPHNRQTTGGWLAGLDAALTEQVEWLAYWFLITSAEFVSGDPLTPMAELLTDDPNAVGVHPALTKDSTSAWVHLIERGGDQPRRTWMIDNIASLYRANWFESIGRFDPELRYGWGIDLETSWTAREAGRSLWVHEGARVKKVTNIGYDMNRMRMTAGEREQAAGANMEQVLGGRYGPGWWLRMNNEFTEEVWR